MDNKSYILLVNREKNFLAAVGQSLLDTGYPVLTATTMNHALDLLSNNRAALIICDSELTDATGYEFLRLLKNNPLLKKIPFVFFVPSHFVTLEVEVSTVLEAFDMGAADFIAYAAGEEVSKVLIKRLGKWLPSRPGGDQIAAGPAEPPRELSENQTTPPRVGERRESERIILERVANIEISRDGVLWMPCRITNVSKDGLRMETSLLGKLGMLLYLRVPLPDGKFILESHIRHISIGGRHLSAEIGVEVEPSKEWDELYRYLMSYDNAAVTPAAAVHEGPAEKAVDAVKTAKLDDGKQRADKALEVKFYRSLIGKQLGNYKAVSFIGAGSMGGVFKGWDVALERNVAMKIISYNLSMIATYRDMFVREARLVSRLTHTNIAQIYHIDQMDDVLYFAMELISGGTLADIIKDRSKFDMVKVLEHFITTCRTLDFVSRQNIVHRDIKPANIMIDEQGTLKVVDFGVAIVDDGTNQKRKDIGFGSPLYVSPDCITGQPLDSRSDIYSLGATFYHVFTGVPPFAGDSVQSILSKHVHEETVPANNKNPLISAGLSDVLTKMMAKKPDQRYQNYQAIIDDLTDLTR